MSAGVRGRLYKAARLNSLLDGDRWETRGLAMTMERVHALTPGDAARRMRTVSYITSFFVPYIPSFLWYPF